METTHDKFIGSQIEKKNSHYYKWSTKSNIVLQQNKNWGKKILRNKCYNHEICGYVFLLCFALMKDYMYIEDLKMYQAAMLFL